MNEPLNSARLQALAAAHGADLRRWPAAERAAAQAALDAGDVALRAALHAADPLDALLDGYRVDAPSRALVDRILATTPQASPLWTRAKLWWSGIGLAGIGVTGAALGALVFAAMAPALLGTQYGGEEQLTAFGDMSFELGLDAGVSDDLEGLLQ